jgi:hypothetical protein
LYCSLLSAKKNGKKYNNRYLFLQKEYGLKLPEWTEKYYPEQMQNLTDFSFVLNVYNDELKKLKGGEIYF